MKRLSFMLCLSALLFTFSITAGASQSEVIPFDSDFTATVSDAHSNVSALALPEVGTFDPANPGYGAQLEDAIAVAAYQALLDQVSPTATEVIVDLEPLNLTNSSQILDPLLAALAAYVYDHPESQFCAINGREYSLSYAAYSVTQLDNSVQLKSSLDAVLSEFKSDFDTSLPVMEQYRTVHDYVCMLASYDYDAAASGIISDAHDAYGLLVHEKKVVCEGYAKAFKVLCDAVGLPCMLAVGEGAQDYNGDGEAEFLGFDNHMWNLVEVDNYWYAVDTTWDDIDGLHLSSDFDLELSLVAYDYFLNNVPFLSGDDQDHISSGEIYFSGYFPMLFSLPQLADGAYPGVDSLIPEEFTITFTSDNMDLPGNLWNYIIGGLPLSDIDHLNLRLTHDVSLTHSIEVPAGKTYTLDSIGSTPFALQRAKNFHGPLFTVSGALELENISPSPALDSPLAAIRGSGSVTDAANRCVVYDGKSPVSIIGYRASYDKTGKMVSLTYMGAIRFTTPGLYLFPNDAVSTTPGAAEKQFLLRDSTFAPLSSGPL